MQVGCNHHLDTHPVTACLSCAHLCRDALKDVLNMWPVPSNSNQYLQNTIDECTAARIKLVLFTMLPCVLQASVMVRSEPPPLLHSRRCRQTTGLSPLGSYTGAAHRHIYMSLTFWDMDNPKCVCNSTGLTVVSLYSELPPSMMMSPDSKRGTC